VSVSPSEFNAFRQFLERKSGIVLGDNKQYLVTSRLKRLLDEHGITSLTELMNQLQARSRSALQDKVIDAMTTNETLWFRDTYPFEVMKNKVIPELLEKQPSQRLRVWSAACSSGQEPYSLSMIMDEYERAHLGQVKAGMQIIATDLSPTMLQACKVGDYDSLAIARGLSQERLQRYFDKTPAGRWMVKPEIKSRVEFRALNLLDSYAGLGKFDVVFCRNVLIYFSAEAKKDILTRMHTTLKPGGYIFLGASEALNGLPELYSMVQCNPGIIYQAK